MSVLALTGIGATLVAILAVLKKFGILYRLFHKVCKLKSHLFFFYFNEKGNDNQDSISFALTVIIWS